MLTSCIASTAKTPSQPAPEKVPEIVTQQEVPKEAPKIVNTTEKKAPSYTLAEVSTHATKDDCWLILDGGVYDVTSYIPRHPGGEKILRGCGKDATQMFAKHPESAKALKEQFKIGVLAQ